MVADGVARTRINYGRDVTSDHESGEFVTGTAEANAHLDAQPAVFLPDDEYGRSLDAFVPVCVDVLVFRPDGHFLLGKRQQEPQPDWWVIGGRMRTRETFAGAAARNLGRELKLKVDQWRLSRRPVSVNSLVWDTRQQAPQEAGCHTLSILLVYRATEAEVAQMVPNEEYAEIGWFTSDQTVGMDIHPALRRMINDAVEHLQY